ncbi:MAG: translesion error-prone DNA polymerase V autoproteolytic subunit [Methylotenera sp.]|nr:translesion error-prone DNA polymerase V autoproteolytic subunit [Methylotenera sp.]
MEYKHSSSKAGFKNISATANKKPLGGRRAGAGRKLGTGKYGESTTVVRVPVSASQQIKDFVTALEIKRKLQSQDNVVKITSCIAPPSHLKLSLPLFSSKVAAGFPSSADEHIEQRIQPNTFLIDNAEMTFCVRVKGDSMIDAGIFDSDVLIVERSRLAQVSDIVLAMLDGEFTVKTLGRSKKGNALLIPANKLYPVIEVKPEQHFEVWGVVTGSMRKFK